MSDKSLASRLRHRITIRRITEVKNGRGGLVDTPVDIAAVWAEVKGLDGRESVMERVLQGVSVFRVTIRWRDDLRVSDQLVSAGSCFYGREVNIRSIVDPDGRREQLVVIGEGAAWGGP
jgi:SPP1 family predicted phage head-tail adaptor